MPYICLINAFIMALAARPYEYAVSCPCLCSYGCVNGCGGNPGCRYTGVTLQSPLMCLFTFHVKKEVFLCSNCLSIKAE